jgi:heavy metal sensor kinase
VFAFTRTIRFKLTVWFVGILAIVILAISGLLYFGLQRVLLQSVDANLRIAGVRSVAPASADLAPGDTTNPESFQSEQLRRLVLLSNTPARLLALDGTLLQSDPLFPRGIAIAQEALATANQGAARFETINVDASTYRLYTAPVKVNNIRTAIIQVVDPLDDQISTLAGLRSLLIWLIPVSLLLAALAGIFLAGRALAPMTRVRSDVEKIIEHSDLTHRVSRGLPDDEVGRLARTFDQLLERVEQAMERERRFTSDASHELRSPLTVLKGEISVALSRDRPAEDYRGTLGQLEATVDDMIQLVEDLLTLTRAASNKQIVSMAPLDIVELVSTIVARLQVIANNKGIVLKAQSDLDVTIVLGDRIKLQRVFTNLIDNALRYTASGGSVDVVARLMGGNVVIDVRDTGRGIAAEHLPRLFQRFYRADNNRARDSGGSGLGLAIAQTITRSHGGRITVESQPGLGSTFTVTLPLAPKQLVRPPILINPRNRVRLNLGKAVNPITVTVHASPRIEMHDRTFRAMNTDISLFLLSGDTRHAACFLDAAEWFFVQAEWRLSRFRDSSELSMLNRAGAGRASRTLFDILSLSSQSYDDTHGIFNPLIGPALAAAGYDRNFDEISSGAVQSSGMQAAAPVPSFNEKITLDPLTNQVTLHDGAQIDLGGIAIGWAIDRAFRTLNKLGPCCINAGGNVRVGGNDGPGSNGWRVNITDPSLTDKTTNVRSVILKDRSIATSGIMRRRWAVNGREQHHLIDPRTAQPAQNNLLFVSAIAETAVRAAVAAKTVFIMGEEFGSAWADERRIPTLIMFRDGEFLCNEYFPNLIQNETP